MDIKLWLEELQKVLVELSQKGLEYYHPEHNKILPSANMELLDTIEAEFQVVLPMPFKEFYSLCGAIYLQVRNGYYINTLEDILRTKENRLEPFQIADPDGGKVIVFGNDDTGENLAIRNYQGKNPGEVIFLPEAFIENKLYYPDDVLGIILIATDFYGFLERLLSDVKAFVRDDEEWDYIGRPKYSE